MKSRFNTSTGRWGAILIMALLLSMMAMPVLAADTDTTTDTEASATTEPNATLKVMVDGLEIAYGDAPPIVKENRTYVGVRALALALGVPEANINWDTPTQTATLTKDAKVVKLVIDSNIMQVDEEKVTMDATPFASNGRVYLPVRYLAEAFDFTVEYDEVANEAVITSPAAPDEIVDGEITTPPTCTVTLAETDSGTTVTIATGATICVALESNPSTGYSWVLTQAPDEAIAASSPVLFIPGATELVGAPGTDYWVFTGVAAGTTSFQLDYTRPGSNEIPAKTFTLTIIVE